MEDRIEIRTIQASDNEDLKNIIKNTLIEYKSDMLGTAFYDTSLENLFNTYQTKKSIYYVALLDNLIVGGCGISPLEGSDGTICELQKMYIKPEGRGKKIGKKLLEKSLKFARESGYKQCYLESFPHMKKALNLYRKNGFKPISTALGNTGHTACEVRMLLNLHV